MSTDTDNTGHREASFVGFGFGCILGGFAVAAGADLIGLPIHTLFAFALGGTAGALAGLVAGRIAGRTIFTSPAT